MISMLGLTRPVAFFGSVVLAFGRGAPNRWRFRAPDFARVLADCSARALLIVLLVNLLVRAILAFVGAAQLVKFGAALNPIP